ncbi:hypothetical protein XbC2_547 [Xanthomonas phage XbC2]|nr:hypothetical protein XbC2_547 [Xanthomonas phage XbC2]
MITLDPNNIPEGFTDNYSFQYDTKEYFKNTDLKNKLNKLFGSSFKAVYSTVKDYDLDGDTIDLSGDTILIFNHKGELIKVNNSEWLFITKL